MTLIVVRQQQPSDPTPDLERQLARFLREVLETRHLYQNVLLPFDFEALDGAVELREERSPKFTTALRSLNAIDGPWFVSPRGPVLPGTVGANIDNSGQLSLRVETAKLFCVQCGSREAHNCEQIDEAYSPRFVPEGDRSVIEQAVVIAWCCQCCKAARQAFMLRRKGRKVSICGRIPMEHVEVPQYLPQQELRHFRSAVVAHQSGETLAGLFLLRVAIEQFARRLSERSIDDVGATTDVEQLFSAYSESQTPQHRNVLPSLYAIYGRLSDAIHVASADEALFEHSLSEIARHFALLRHLNAQVST